MAAMHWKLKEDGGMKLNSTCFFQRGLAEAWDARLSAARTKVHGPEALEARSHGLIWGLPKMGVPPNHLKSSSH